MQRYFLSDYYDGPCMEEDSEGDWVKHEDAIADLAAKTKECERLREALEQIKSGLLSARNSCTKAKLMAMVQKQPNKEELFGLIRDVIKEEIAIAEQALKKEGAKDEV